ncbi:hypothetical protein SBA3_2730015 [Candidatus Sulfopaludibacter sp. SbA3]|nr:hypothetical protein SBA3_2730015 [Candidatus Sulfopaludibacter sp. SbA3]
MRALFFLLAVLPAGAARRPIPGVKRPAVEQDAINPGTPAELLEQKGWHMFDGRSSQAMLELIDHFTG